jgi:serine/threonine protein kinase
MTDEEFERQILSFERAWRSNGSCDIALYLEGPMAIAPRDRHRLLVELICIDLEFRWRHGPRNSSPRDRVLLEDYVARFPELVSLDRLPLELIAEEYRVRHRWGDRPSHAEFLSRFQHGRERIRAGLLWIDDQLEEESVALHARSRPDSGSARPGTPPDLMHDGPLFNHQDFLLERMIGAGRMGKVYEAWQRGASRPVAVKFLRKSFLDEPRIVRRFIGEARTIAKLGHPNIVGIHGLGRTPAGSYFIVMDLVDGPDLDLVVRTRPIAVTEAIRWTIETCHALEHAHARGIIHCDLKPANLVLDRDGSVRVTDFGLARSRDEDARWTAEVEGTAPFMAPEQASRCHGEIEVRTDVYGIGAILFTLLTGRPPWVGRRLPDILADVISAAPVIPPTRLRPDLPESVGDFCRKCLSKTPHDRYQSIRDARAVSHEGLRRILNRLPLPSARARSPSWYEASIRFPLSCAGLDGPSDDDPSRGCGIHAANPDAYSGQ